MSQKTELTFVVGADQAGSRLDALLAELSGQSRTTVSNWVKDGEVQLLDARGRGVKAKASYKLLEGMTVQAAGTPPRDLRLRLSRLTAFRLSTRMTTSWWSISPPALLPTRRWAGTALRLSGC